MMSAFLSALRCFAVALTVTALSACALAQQYSLGVYYYPGWSPGISGAAAPDPWQPIKRFPEREPLLGWYHDGRVEVVERQLQWMHQYGIDFVVFDWYWDKDRPAPETSVRAYLQASTRRHVRYALLWANHFKEADATKQWDAMVDYWLQRHLKNPEYLRIDGRPAVFIFSGDFLRENATNARTTARALLESAQSKARAAGLPGIYFVLCTPALEYWAKGFAREAGFSALSAYNYHFGFAGSPESATPMSHSFGELDRSYRMQWQWILANSSLPYFLPMTSGWDRRPWGGTKEDPLHDQSAATMQDFETHLRAAKTTMDAFPEKTKGIGVICCWNEFGEGAYIEPTKQAGFGFLERLKKVFRQ